jgi:hypothetical protein
MKKTQMEKSALAFAPLFLGSALVWAVAPGCANGAPDPGDTAEVAQPAQAGERAASVALRIEQAERQLDLGRDVAAARAALSEIAADAAVSSEERDQATLALSRAHEMLGDTKAAVAAVEGLLAAHADDEGWPLEKAAETRLRKLLTGAETAPKTPVFEDTPIAPIAHVLASHFTPLDDGKRYRPSMVMFNARRGVSDQLGTFNVGGAIREKRAQSCPLCEDDLQIGRDETRYGSWVEIPVGRRLMDNALVVFYFDLGAGRVPSHYDDLLPMPSDEVVARLERGEGVVAAKTRAGAPPVLLLAAPRAAQLAEVEAAFAAMEALPASPSAVPVSQGLAKEEIQQVVRGARTAMKGCYETLLSSKPQAAGKVVMKFTVLPSGNVSDAMLEPDAALDDATLVGCLRSTVDKMAFPTTPNKTTVAYPIAFAP